MTDPFQDAPGTGDLPVAGMVKPLTGTSPEAEALDLAAGTELVLKHEAPADTSDGYHTFAELYEHRRALTTVLATVAAVSGDSWRSKRHHPDDGPMFDGYFIVGIELPDGPITYHYPLADWDKFDLVEELEHADKWDGATAQDTPVRLDRFAAHLRDAIREGREVQAAARAAAADVEEKAERGSE